MGQQLFKTHLEAFDVIVNDNVTFKYKTVLSDDDSDDLSFLSSSKLSTETESDTNNSISNSEKIFLKRIQNQLAILTKPDVIEELETKLNNILMGNVFTSLESCHKEALQQITEILENQQRLEKSLANKSEEDKLDDVSIFVPLFFDSFLNNKDKQEQRKSQQLSYFALQSLLSLLLILIKTAEKNDPIIIDQILTLASQLCEQMPMKCLSTSNTNLLFRSLKPLISYINELSLSNDTNISKQALRILLSFSVVKTSLKDILPFLNQLILDTTDIHNVIGLFMQLNNGLTKMIAHQSDSINENNPTTSSSLDHLKSLGVYSNSELMQLDEKLFTSQFISSVILSHIDIYNDIHSNEKFQNGSIESSFSFEFHPNTFKQLFDMIEKLSTIMIDHTNTIILHTLVICLKLFTTHLKFLSAIKSNIDRDLSIKKLLPNFSSDSKNTFDLTSFVSDNELQKWFELLLKLACDQDQKLERTVISKEASKALIYLLNQRTTSFLEKLVFMHQYIIENQYPILINEILIELNKKEILLSWIEVLCESKYDESTRRTAMKILYSFIDIFFKSSNEINEEHKQQIQNIIFSFQQLLLYHLVSRSVDNTNNELDVSTLNCASFFVSEYITYIFKKSVKQTMIMKELFHSILLGLGLMTKTNEIFHFLTIQPIFATIIPLLADHLLENTTIDDDIDKYRNFLSWLIGKMCHVMLFSSSLNSLEMKYTNKLKSAIFTGGCENQTIENSQYLSHLYNSNLALFSQFSIPNQDQTSSYDKEFLMSIYNNTGEGAQLITRLKTFLKNKHSVILKSIEQQTNELCAVIFAVYIKHYRRINLATYELTRSQETQPHHELMSLFEYANNVQTIFATTKGQGGDCNELYQQIKTNALFLLLSVKESDLIPIIEEEFYRTTPDIFPKKKFHYQRQVSRWSKAKIVIRLLRNVMRACIRFKKLMLTKKRATIQKYDNESNLKQAIDVFIYGKYSKVSILMINEVKHIELEEINTCLLRQYERAMTRLITYRFFQRFIEKICNLKDLNQVIRILHFYLPYLRSINLEWYYLENILAVNNQIKEDIRKTYYLIIKTILSYSLKLTTVQSKILLQNLFYLLDFSYESHDIDHMYDHQFAITLFTSFVSYIQDPGRNVSLDLKFVGFDWFRLFVIKLCENIRMDILRHSSNQILRRQREIVFHTFILNELKGLKQLKDTLSIDTDDKINNSLKHIAVDWFVQRLENNPSTMLNKLEVDLCTNQYLTLLLRCVYYYEHVRFSCATVDYIEELLFIYQHSKHNTTVLLALKILRQLIPFLPETPDGKSNVLIEKLLSEILFSIGESFIFQQMTPEIVTELIYIYRTIMCISSVWQMLAIELVFTSITLHLNMKSIKTNDQNQMNHLLASLIVLGGHIQPFCLSATVKLSSDEQQLATIIEVNKDSTGSNATPYFIQYMQTNHKQWIATDQLQLEIDVLPPNLSLLPNAQSFIDPILDALGYFIQSDTSTTESVLLLQLKRRCISALYYLIDTQELIEIFIQKPYVSIIAELAMSNSLSKTSRQPADLRLFSKQHLEQYSLSLDTCERLKQIVETNDNENILNDTSSTNKQLIIDTLSTSIWKYSSWKPYTAKAEIQLFKKGRFGTNEISIVPMPSTAADIKAIEECGNKRQFKGRVNLSSGTIHVNLPTFIINNIQVSEGKWYFCVRVPSAGLQIGWATIGFTPRGNGGVALGDDRCSWSYDGTRDILLNNGVYYNRFGEDNRWKENDVCGCGIDIDGENTNIKYWLNGKYLGTAFRHQTNIGSSYTECNLMPNGSNPIYFPGVSLQYDNYPTASCEFIFSPEDMQECPLPDGYKPLLLPKSIHIENSIVAYPYNAYLVGDNVQDYLYNKRTITSTTMLRDFVSEHHLETDFNLEENQLILPGNSLGFPLSIDNDAISLTISFDFQILSTTNNKTDDQVNIQLLTSDPMETFSIDISSKRAEEKISVIIVLRLKEQQTQVYINNICQTFNTQFQIDSKTKLNVYLLPKIHAGISNIAVWKYVLSEEHIHRLTTYGLSYIAIDYQQMKEYRKRANTFTFTNNEFSSELLVPFDELFEESIWEKKKKQMDNDQSKYFKSNDQSTISFYGNNTYLVLDKSNDIWLEYTLILDISIPNWPNIDEHITLVTLNQSSQLCINHDGQLYLIHNETNTETESKLNLNEYFRLWISVRDQRIKIYVNGKLEIETMSTDDDVNQFHATLNRFELFRETDFTKNTTNENTLRIQCQSITFRNQSIPIDEQIAKANSSLEIIVTPSWSILAPSLIAIGYKKEWILSAMKRYNTTNIQILDSRIREHEQEFFEEELDNEQNRCLKIMSRLNPDIDQNKLKDTLNSSKMDVDKQIIVLSQFVLTDWKDLQTSNSSEHNLDKYEELSKENKWFHQSIRGLDINENLIEWMRDKSIKPSDSDKSYKLYDLSQSTQDKSNHKSFQYSHQNLSQKQYLNSRIACEHGLTIIYARYTILNILKIWSTNTITFFPLEKLGDYTFLVPLLRLMDYYNTYSSTHTDENIDQTSLLINSILQGEIKQLSEHIDQENLSNQIPFLFQLQKDMIAQILHILLNPSLLENSSNDDIIINEQEIITQPNINFIFKILNLFLQLLSNQSIIQDNQIEILISLFFPLSMINLIFDLFLVIPIHQSKFFLLQFFSKLMQKSEQFQLPKSIEHFLVNLLIQNSLETRSTNSQLSKNLETIIMEVIFLILSKSKKQKDRTNVNEEQTSQLNLEEFSQNIRNLFTIIDVINLLIDQKKQTISIERFFTQSQDYLGEGNELNQEEFDKSHAYFDINADQQLINFMNKDSRLANSFSDFIRSLPSESAVDAVFYVNYPSLSSIQADYIQIRAKFIYQLNQLIIIILPLIDFNLLPGESYLTDQIRRVKMYLLYSTKLQLLNETFNETHSGYNDSWINLSFDTVKASITNENSEHTMFHQAYEQLHTEAHITFRRLDHQIWHSQYLGMHSTDQGGPYRDSISRICSDLCSSRLSLFILCPNGRTDTGLNRDCWIPNVFPPNKPISNHLKKQYRFVGQLMGMAIRRKHYLDLKFAPIVWKELLREEITIEDIQAIDMQSFTIITEMEKNIEPTKVINGDQDTNYLFNSIMSELRFDVVSSSGQTYELIPNGMDIPISAANFKQYCTSYRQYRLNEFHRQIDFLRQGLFSVVPCYYLSLFTANELEEAVCGKGHIDVELLKKNTQYHSRYRSDSPLIQRFWSVFDKMFTNEQKKAFLIFVWGRNTLPRRDEDFDYNFTISTYDVNPGDVIDRLLPLAHTCTFTIDLPEYSTVEIMYERLNYAITYCSSIDGDGVMNDAPNEADHGDDTTSEDE